MATWKGLVSEYDAEATYAAPATALQLAQAERDLGVTLPEDLRELLQESNGASGRYGVVLIWPIERIVADNLAFRSKPDFRERYMPFDHLLFFSDAGNGDQFAYRIMAGAIRDTEIYAWSHEDDSRTWVAPGLAKFLAWWLTGVIKL